MSMEFHALESIGSIPEKTVFPEILDKIKSFFRAKVEASTDFLDESVLSKAEKVAIGEVFTKELWLHGDPNERMSLAQTPRFQEIEERIAAENDPDPNWPAISRRHQQEGALLQLVEALGRVIKRRIGIRELGYYKGKINAEITLGEIIDICQTAKETPYKADNDPNVLSMRELMRRANASVSKKGGVVDGEWRDF